MYKTVSFFSHQGGEFVGVEHEGAEVEGGSGHQPWRPRGDGRVLAQGHVQRPAVAAARGRLRRRHRQLPLLLRKRLHSVSFLLKQKSPTFFIFSMEKSIDYCAKDDLIS